MPYLQKDKKEFVRNVLEFKEGYKKATSTRSVIQGGIGIKTRQLLRCRKLLRLYIVVLSLRKTIF